MISNLSNPPTLFWSSDLTPTANMNVAHQAHIWTKAFANRHVAVALPDRNVIHAHDVDVLGGRGKHLERHPGNVRLTELVDVLKISYHLGTFSTKREIVDRILNTMVKDENRRFLKLVPYQRDANIWYWVPDSKSRAKVGQKLRDAYQSWSKEHSGSSQTGIDIPTARVIQWLPVDNTAAEQIKPAQIDAPEIAKLPKTQNDYHQYVGKAPKSIVASSLVPQPRDVSNTRSFWDQLRSRPDLQREVREASSSNTLRQDEDRLSLSEGISKSRSTQSQQNVFSFSRHASQNAGTAAPPTLQPQVQQEGYGGSSATTPRNIGCLDLEAVGAPETELDASSTTTTYHSQDFTCLTPGQRNENAPDTSTQHSIALIHSIDHCPPRSKSPSSKFTTMGPDPNQTIASSTFFDESSWFFPVHDDQQYAPSSITPAGSLRLNEA